MQPSERLPGQGAFTHQEVKQLHRVKDNWDIYLGFYT
jgi:hypothetical protein